MDVAALSAKAALAVMLLIAGSAKLADLASFAAAVRLMLSFRVPRAAGRAAALGIAVAELALGGASLSLPQVKFADARGMLRCRYLFNPAPIRSTGAKTALLCCGQSPE